MEKRGWKRSGGYGRNPFRGHDYITVFAGGKTKGRLEANPDPHEEQAIGTH